MNGNATQRINIGAIRPDEIGATDLKINLTSSEYVLVEREVWRVFRLVNRELDRGRDASDADKLLRRALHSERKNLKLLREVGGRGRTSLDDAVRQISNAVCNKYSDGGYRFDAPKENQENNLPASFIDAATVASYVWDDNVSGNKDLLLGSIKRKLDGFDIQMAEIDGKACLTITGPEGMDVARADEAFKEAFAQSCRERDKEAARNPATFYERQTAGMDDPKMKEAVAKDVRDIWHSVQAGRCTAAMTLQDERELLGPGVADALREAGVSVSVRDGNVKLGVSCPFGSKREYVCGGPDISSGNPLAAQAEWLHELHDYVAKGPWEQKLSSYCGDEGRAADAAYLKETCAELASKAQEAAKDLEELLGPEVKAKDDRTQQQPEKDEVGDR